MKMTSMQSADRKNLAVFGAFCLFLSAIEYLIPKPLPFLRIGLANLPLMLALDIFSFPKYFVLVCIKIIGQALITGTMFSYIFLFSVAGTFCSAIIMYALRKNFKEKHLSFIGIGAAGAMVSNTAQLALAWFFVFKDNVRYIAPPFLIMGLITGVGLGAFCEMYVRKSKFSLAKPPSRQENDLQYQTPDPRPKTLVLFILGLLTMLFIVFIPSTEVRTIIFLVLWLLAIIFKKNTKPHVTFLIILFIVAFNLIIPYGKVLYAIGPFKITLGALKAGIHRAVTFQALVMLSKLCIREDLKLPGTFGELLGESLRMFSVMMNKKYNFKSKNIIAVIDEILFFTTNKHEHSRT